MCEIRRGECRAKEGKTSMCGGILLRVSTPQCDLNQQLQLGAPERDTKGSLCKYRTARKIVKENKPALQICNIYMRKRCRV